MPDEKILTFPAGGLTSAQYKQLETVLAEWEAEVRENAARLPRRGYDLGVEQALAFLRMLGRIGQTDLPPAGEFGPTRRAAVEWQNRHTMHELNGAVARYVDEVKSAVLYGLRGGANPTEVAGWLHKATKDASVNWRLVARTEMVRANAAGRLDAIEAMGYSKVWAPRHTGACESCRTLLEGRVFSIDEVRDKTNYGRKRADWIACIPLHPGCRHTWAAWIPDVFDQAEREYQRLAVDGLDDETLDAMFDSSGQVKPEFANDPRLGAYFDAHGKSHDPFLRGLALAVAKTRLSDVPVGKSGGQEPPGLHHTSGRRNCGCCDFYERPECTRYSWPVDRDELCAGWEPRQMVGKGYFDNPQGGLDPLLWTSDETLRLDVQDRILGWWRGVFSADAPAWSHLFITGSSTSRAWAGKTAGDVDVQVIVDYAALRRYHPEYAALSDPELHAALRTQLLASTDGLEAANGLPMEAFIRPEQTVAQFEADVADKGQGVWDLGRARWVVRPPAEPTVEDVDHGLILEGEGARVALEHPEWLVQARKLAAAMGKALEDPTSSQNRQELQRAYTYVHDLRAREFASGNGTRGIGNFLWRYLMDYGPLARVKHLLQPTGLEKVFPLYELSGVEIAKGLRAAGRGAEHTVTLRPHAESRHGIEIKVRDGGNGTATVIGGAGGYLNHLRIRPY